jgi:hypothetical protein
VCSIRAARSAGELEVAPELVIIAAAGDELPEFTWMPDGRVCRVIWLRGYPDLDAPSRTGDSWQRRACPQRRGTRLIRTSMTSASGGVVVIGPSLLRGPRTAVFEARHRAVRQSMPAARARAAI